MKLLARKFHYFYKISTFFLGGLLVFLAILQVFFSNHYTDKAVVLEVLESKTNQIEEENKITEELISQAISLGNIKTQAEKLAMKKNQSVIYMETVAMVAWKNNGDQSSVISH